MQKLTKSEFMKKYVNDKYRKRFKEKEARKEVDDYCTSRNVKQMNRRICK